MPRLQPLFFPMKEFSAFQSLLEYPMRLMLLESKPKTLRILFDYVSSVAPIRMTWENAVAWKMLLRYRRLLEFMVKPSKSKLGKPATAYFDNEDLVPIDELLLVKVGVGSERFADRT